MFLCFSDRFKEDEGECVFRRKLTTDSTPN
jgi:hypothetical protein